MTPSESSEEDSESDKIDESNTPNGTVIKSQKFNPIRKSLFEFPQQY